MHRNHGFAGAVVSAVLAGTLWLTTAAAAGKSPRGQRERAFFAHIVQRGYVKGVRAVELIRPDLLAVTIDPAITKWGFSQGPAGDVQKPETFSVTSETDASCKAPVRPAKVARRSFEYFNGVAKGPMAWKTLWWHTYYLYLPRPLASGHTYTVKVAGIDAPFRSTGTLAYDDGKTSTKVIKINQVAYSSRAGRRYAYLGWWAGDGGKVDFAPWKRFRVIDEKAGKCVLTGEITLRKADDDLAGEDVYEMDLARLGAGTYHIHVPGLARSETFHVGGDGLRELYFHTMRAFFHQRCGQEFREPWTWVKKPACHLEVWESGRLVDGPGAIYCLWKRVKPYQPKPNERRKSFRGGYHDAADFDTFSYHLPATAQILAAYEISPGAFRDKDLNLPESGNGVPDVLDEAAWGLRFHLENQEPNGVVPLGRGNECDAFKQNTGGKLTPYGVLPPGRNSTATFGAVAAQFARLVRPFGAALAGRHLAAARKAYAWASQHDSDVRGTKRASFRKPTLAWAAAELFATTGEAKYNEDYKLRVRDRSVRFWWKQHLRAWAYLRSARADADKETQAALRKALIGAADKQLAKMETVAYRHSAGPRVGAWGSMVPAQQADTLLRAWAATGERKYFDAASLHADFQLGCNPMSKTFITDMGYRHPNRPEISWFLYEGPAEMTGRTVKGLTIYTLGPPLKFWHPRHPVWRSHRDVWGNGAEIWSEFTLHQTIGPTAMMLQVLYAAEGRGR
jgi:endoglucanase